MVDDLISRYIALTYRATFDDKRWKISRRLNLLLKLQQYTSHYLYIKNIFLFFLLVIQAFVGDNFLKYIKISSILNVTGGPACHIYGRFALSTVIVTLYTYVLIRPVAKGMKYVSKCELYHQVINPEIYFDQSIELLGITVDSLMMTTTKLYNKYFISSSPNIRNSISESYNRQIYDYKMIKHNLTKLFQIVTPRHIVTQYLFAAQLLSIFSILSFSYLVLFFKSTLDIEKFIYDTRNKHLHSLGISNTNLRCHYSSLEIAFLLVVASQPVHSMLHFGLMSIFNFWIEMRKIKSMLSENVLFIDDIDFRNIEYRSEIELMKKLDKFKIIEDFLLISLIKINALELRMKNTVKLINTIMSPSILFLILTGFSILSFKAIGLIPKSTTIIVLALSIASNVCIICLSIVNTTCEKLICNDLLILMAHTVKANQEITDALVKYNVKTNYHNNIQVNKYIKDDAQQVTSTFQRRSKVLTNFITLEPTVLNPFTMFLWLKKLKYLKIMREKLTISIFGVPINHRFVSTVSRTSNYKFKFMYHSD